MPSHNGREIKRMVSAIETAAIRSAKFVMVTIHTGTIQKLGESPGTPVDTHEAESGGRVGLNSAPTFKPAKNSTYSKLMPEDISRELDSMRLGDTIHWVNNVDHASILEGGRRYSAKAGRMIGSEQAPDGFLNLSVEEASDRLKNWNPES